MKAFVFPILWLRNERLAWAKIGLILEDIVQKAGDTSEGIRIEGLEKNIFSVYKMDHRTFRRNLKKFIFEKAEGKKGLAKIFFLSKWECQIIRDGIKLRERYKETSPKQKHLLRFIFENLCRTL